MRKFFTNRLTRAAAAAALTLGLGLGLAANGFAATHVANDRAAVTDPQQAGPLGVAELESLLRAADNRVSVITTNDETHFEYFVPAHNGHPDRHIVIGISPNHRYVDICCVVASMTGQNAPTRQQLIGMLQRNFDNTPSCFGIEGNSIRLDICLPNLGITTADLKAQLRQFRNNLQDAEQLLASN